MDLMTTFITVNVWMIMTTPCYKVRGLRVTMSVKTASSFSFARDHKTIHSNKLYLQQNNAQEFLQTFAPRLRWSSTGIPVV